MRFNNKFRIGWWAALTVGTGFFLAPRYGAFAVGQATALDGLVFLLWVALLLTPVFAEISFAGLKLKQDIEILKTDLTAKITDLRNDVRAEVRATINPTIHINQAPISDAGLPELKQQAEEAVSQLGLGSDGVAGEAPPAVPSSATVLFEARYALELELRRIARQRDLVRDRAPTTQILRLMRSNELIDGNLERVLREVHLICSTAIHADQVSDAQVAFVKEVLPEMLAALRGIR